MTLNYLYSKKTIKQFEKSTGVKLNLPLTRRTGKSTALALHTIAKAIAFPSTPIKIFDHLSGKKAQLLQLNRIKHLIKVMELKGFNFDNNKLTITFLVLEQ